MTITELRQKHPEETKNWTDDVCQQYCRNLESLVTIFLDNVEKQIQETNQNRIDTYAN